MLTFADINSYDLSTEVNEFQSQLSTEDLLLEIREENRVWEETLCLLYA